MTRPQIDVEIRTGMCTALLQAVFRNLEVMDAAIAQTSRLAGPNSYILACNSSLSSLKNRKRRLSILLAQLSGKKRARVRTPGDVRRVGEPMERLAHVRQPLGLGGELDERCAERLSAGRLDEAEQTFAEAEQDLLQLSSASHSAAAWTARGELALARGDDKEASTLFRRAAEALQENAI